ncbi:MAG TPA: ABC transporter permease [Lentimicrobium sp.]|nr:ABC transporter permease [Lentimicrobium sp.]
MRTLLFLLRKEFVQIFRNKTILGMMIVMPVMQLLILPLAANYEVKNINLVVVDNDVSTWSKQLVSTITSSGYFRLVNYNQSYKKSLKYIESDEADLILEIPNGFEKDLIRENELQVLIAVNAINGIKANIGASYLNNIIREYNHTIRTRLLPQGDNRNSFAQQGSVISGNIIEVTYSNWFNPGMNYRNFMVPGILAILVTMIGGFMTALNIVKEKEIGTIEQINVTPIKKQIFILGKLIPFWILGNIVFSLGLLAAWLIYGIVPQGSIIVLYSFIWVYLLAVLGFGLLVSTYSENQQQAMFVLFFFMMIFILLGGLFTSIDSMPSWAKVIAAINPVTYIIEVFRMIVLKGSGLRDILPHIGIIALIAFALNSWAIWNYRKTS